MPVDTRMPALLCRMNKWRKAGALQLLSCLIFMPLNAAPLPYLAKLATNTTPPAPAATSTAINSNTPSPADEKAAYAALADILNNDAARAELIKRLRAASQGQSSLATPLLTPADEEKDTPTLLESVTDFIAQVVIVKDHGSQTPVHLKGGSQREPSYMLDGVGAEVKVL